MLYDFIEQCVLYRTYCIKNGWVSQQMEKNRFAIFYAILAAALYAINAPLSKLLLKDIPTTFMAGLLYLGAGTGMYIVQKFSKNRDKQVIPKKEMPYTVAMVVLDIAAPICLMIGLAQSSAASASLLNNFEIVATSIIALAVFKEKISKRLWLAIVLITASSIMLSMEDIQSFSFSIGAVFVLLACICWGFENNCTRKLSNNNPAQIVVIKGFGSGIGAIAVALVIGERYFDVWHILLAMLLGFVAYGLSIYYYIYAQRFLGAAKTSAYYAVSPFIGALMSLIIFAEIPSVIFVMALAVMAAGAYFAIDG